ncbi:MAG: hypothetical protein CL677_03335 [Bdellovibrionaceae bacterium]|nr:hypothetical protein [Pseudobdellovibrionaceae bacterium]
MRIAFIFTLFVLGAPSLVFSASDAPTSQSIESKYERDQETLLELASRLEHSTKNIPEISEQRTVLAKTLSGKRQRLHGQDRSQFLLTRFYFTSKFELKFDCFTDSQVQSINTGDSVEVEELVDLESYTSCMVNGLSQLTEDVRKFNR